MDLEDVCKFRLLAKLCNDAAKEAIHSNIEEFKSKSFEFKDTKFKEFRINYRLNKNLAYYLEVAENRF
jgi:hypothetical protein